MLRCSHCDRILADADQPCPECATVSETGDSAAQVTEHAHQAVIARFGNAAESGYFANELREHYGIEADVSIDDSFNALGGYWTTRFVLSVPAAVADTARSTLKSLLEEDADDSLPATEVADGEQPTQWPADAGGVSQAGLSDFNGAYERRTADSEDAAFEDEPNLPWVPIVLTLAAGSLAFWAVRKFAEPPNPAVMVAPNNPQQQDLWEQLSRDPAPWFQRINQGRGMRELRLIPERDLAIIREDADGDGTFERAAAVQRRQ